MDESPGIGSHQDRSGIEIESPEKIVLEEN